MQDSNNAKEKHVKYVDSEVIRKKANDFCC
jgi:hypothetical protein